LNIHKTDLCHSKLTIIELVVSYVLVRLFSQCHLVVLAQLDTSADRSFYSFIRMSLLVTSLR